MTPSLEEADRFLGLARADFEAFRVLAANSHIRPAIALFHAQQSVEKSLKAGLFASKLEFRRTHESGRTRRQAPTCRHPGAMFS